MQSARRRSGGLGKGSSEGGKTPLSFDSVLKTEPRFSATLNMRYIRRGGSGVMASL